MHQPKSRFAQNFLCDQNIIAKIIDIINPSHEQNLIEIGPGCGALTLPILQKTKKLTAIEIDKDLIKLLQRQSANNGALVIYQGDALKFDFSQLIAPDNKSRVFGNLPYNISTPIIFHLLKNADLIEDMTFMLQLEVVERMCAKHGSKNYGRLSVMVQYHCSVQHVFNVPATAFSPKPKVISAIVILKPYTELPVLAKNYNKFVDLVRAAFNQRRKTLKNSLCEFISVEQLTNLSIEPRLRAEMLTVADFVKIANYVF